MTGLHCPIASVRRDKAIPVYRLSVSQWNSMQLSLGLRASAPPVCLVLPASGRACIGRAVQ